MRRLFIAINIPKDIKEKISKKRDLLESLIPSIRFVGEENWHLTLVFLGEQSDEAILPIIKSMKDLIPGFTCPGINFSDISYGPVKGAPRMVWLNGDENTSKTLSVLKTQLEDELIKNGVRFKLENREFRTHITLAKFSEDQRSGLPDLGGEFKGLNWFFEAESLDLMESRLSGKGAEYEVLQRIDFGGN
ncbi:MAG: RNA 2',3'-cyclic phosphodiesterase [bacterium]|nr:RNA 2',3'-cyclic phosphodiesterase [bacterium]